MKIYAIKDKLVGFKLPFFAPRHEVAIRSMKNGLLVEQKGSPYFAFPEYYVLCCLGIYDEDTGEIKPLEEIEVVSEFSDLVSDIEKMRREDLRDGSDVFEE